MTTQLILMFALMAAAMGYTFWMRGRASKALDAAKPAFVTFFQRTGFRYADMPDAPPELQAERSFRDAKSPRPQSSTGNSSDLHYIRDYHGIRMQYRHSTGWRKEGQKTIYWYSNLWEADVPHPPRIPIHIADKALDSTFKAAKELFSNSKRNFTPKCSQRIQTGNPAIDAKFVVFGDNPQAVQWLFQQYPALVQLLDGWAELDVSVTHAGAVFSDPSQHNMQAAMGGTIGSMALGLDYAKRLELGIPVHDRVADLLATLVRATA